MLDTGLNCRVNRPGEIPGALELAGSDADGIVKVTTPSGIAQLAERRTVNPQVAGSIPAPGAT
jgi:hypothetical protein